VAETRSRWRRTRLWFAFYTGVLFVLVVVSVADKQWSVAATALATATLFALFTRRLRRRR